MAKAIRMKVSYAVVIGDGLFPLDMLRYDRCFPFAQEDIQRMDNGCREMRAIVLERRAENPIFTEKRWESFGWTCNQFDDTCAALDFKRGREQHMKTKGLMA